MKLPFKIDIVFLFELLNKKTRELFSKINLPDYTVLTLFSIFIGASVGLAAVLFHHSIAFFNEIFFDRTAEGLFFLGGFAVIALPAIGMLIQSLMILSAPETAKKKGVAEIIKTVATRGAKISFRTTLFHFFAPVISIGSGNTVGPEGPAAQLGGGVANKLAVIFNLSENRKRVFTAAGAGAAISAIFNTPLGGIFFALEVVMLNEFQKNTFSALILSSVTASAVSRIFLGNDSVFLFDSPQVGAYLYFHLYALLGIAAGFISIGFIKYSNAMDDLFRNKVLTKLPQWFVMTFIGLAVGVCGYFYEDLFGIGYGGINNILSGSLTWNIVAIIFILKFLLVPLILNSGGFGGIFAPSLFMGAGFGFLYSSALNHFFGLNLDVTAFVLVSMGAILGGINSIPISAILIIFEMTKDYTFILPLMIAVVISTMIVQIVLKRTVHERHLEKQGYRIAPQNDASVLKTINVSAALRKDVVLIPEELPLPQLIERLLESNHKTFYTVDKMGNLRGTITENELLPMITEYDNVRALFVARDIASSKVTTVTDIDSLDQVMKLFERKEADEFPVVDSESNSIIGSIQRHDVIAIFNKESLRQDVAEGLSHELEKIKTQKQFKLFDNFLIAEKTVPSAFVGKSLRELNLRSNFSVQIIMIRQQSSIFNDEDNDQNLIIPEATYTLQNDDALIIFGLEKDVLHTKVWYN